MPSPTTRPPQYMLMLLPALIACAAYLSSLSFEYVWDDFYYVVESGRVATWNAAWNSAFMPYLGIPHYFRPLGILSLGIGSATLAHAINLALHAINSSLTAVLYKQHARSPHTWMAVIAGSLYALHPALIETVSWVSCRFDLLLTLFGLLLLLNQYRPETGRRSLISGLLFLLAALSKESAIALYPIFLLLGILDSKAYGTWSQRLIRQAFSRDGLAIVAAGCIYLIFRMHVLDGLHASARAPLEHSQHLLLTLKTLGFYIGLTLLPFWNFGVLHELQLPVSATDWHVFTALLLPASLAVLVSRYRAYLPWLGGYFLALLPVSNALQLGIGENFAHDRLLTLPLVFAVCGIAALLQAASAGNRYMKGSLAGALLVWVIFCVTTIAGNQQFWRSNLTLWNWAAMRYPASDVAQNNLLTSLNEKKLYADTIHHSQKLETIRNGKLTTLQRLATARAWSAKEQPRQALLQLDRIVIDYSAKLDDADLASLCAEKAWPHMQLGELDTARKLLEAALRKGATDPEVQYHLGAVISALGDETTGIPLIQNALDRAPRSTAERWHAEGASLITGLRALSTGQEPHEPKAGSSPLMDACIR